MIVKYNKIVSIQEGFENLDNCLSEWVRDEPNDDLNADNEKEDFQVEIDDDDDIIVAVFPGTWKR